MALAMTIGSFFLGHRVSSAAKPIEGGVETTGVVVEHVSDWSSENESWKSVVQFTTAAGESIRFVGDVSSNRVKPVGTNVRVSYDPAHPQGAHNLDGPERWAGRFIYGFGIFLASLQIRQLLRWLRRDSDLDGVTHAADHHVPALSAPSSDAAWTDGHQTPRGVIRPWAGGMAMIAFGIAFGALTVVLSPERPDPLENGVTTSGRIVGIVEGRSTRGDSGTHSIYRSEISFTTQELQTVQFVDPQHTTSKSKHHVGDIVRVSYDPANPAATAQNLDAHYPGVSVAALMMALVLVGVGVLAIWRGNGSNIEEPKCGGQGTQFPGVAGRSIAAAEAPADVVRST